MVAMQGRRHHSLAIAVSKVKKTSQLLCMVKVAWATFVMPRLLVLALLHMLLLMPSHTGYTTHCICGDMGC